MEALVNFHNALLTSPELMAVNLIEEGALQALVLHLHCILPMTTKPRAEIKHIVCLINLLLKSCPKHLRSRIYLDLNVDFFNLLSSELLQIQNEVSSAHRALHFPWLEILHISSSTLEGSHQILRSRITLIRLTFLLRDVESSEDSLCEILGVLKNVSFYCEEDRRYLLSLPHFLVSLTELASRTFSEKIIELLSAILRNVSLSFDCQHAIASSSDVLGAICRMAGLPNAVVLRNILKTLTNLAMNHELCVLILLHSDGLLLNIIKRLIRSNGDNMNTNNSSSSVRRRSARILRLLSNESSIQILLRDSDVIPLLANLAWRDKSPDVRYEASETFARCAAMVNSDQSNYDTILDGLMLLRDNNSISAESFARALKGQSCSKKNCEIIARRQDLVDAIVNIAISTLVSGAVKVDACSVLWNLSNEFSKNASIIASSSILHALVQNASISARNEDEMDPIIVSRQKLAIQTIAKLAEQPLNRKTMVCHDKLLQTLIQFASTQPDNEVKAMVKQVILWLVEEV